MKTTKLKRVFHPWHKWEDYKSNFYGGVVDDYPRDNTLQVYASLLRDTNKFEDALKNILVDWKHSLEHNLTNESMNRVAYMGQAACAYVYKVPHHVSMPGYNLLSDKEKEAADAMAQKYIDIWEAQNEHLKEVQE